WRRLRGRRLRQSRDRGGWRAVIACQCGRLSMRRTEERMRNPGCTTMMKCALNWISLKWDQATGPFVPAKAGTQSNGSNSQSRWLLGSHLRGNERESGAIRTRPARRLWWSSMVLSAALAVSAAQPVSAQEKLRVGKAVAESFAFVPLDVG